MTKKTTKKTAQKSSEQIVDLSKLTGAQVLSALTKLKPRQRKYVERRIQGQTKQDAALEAGYSKSVAQTGARDVEESEAVQNAFRLLVRKAIKPEKVVERLAEGLDAIETRTFTNVMGSKQKGTDRIEITEKDYIAWTERRKYLELACEYGGYVDPKLKVDHTGDVTVIHEHIGG